MRKDDIFGQLPDLFRFQDGTLLTDPSDWPRRRAEIAPAILETQYGGMPPEPEVFRAEPLHFGAKVHTYRIHAGTREKTLTFCVQLFVPKDMARDAKLPVVLTGDGCYRDMSEAVIGEINRRGMIAAMFNRTELAPDLYNQDRDSGLYLVYPDAKFGALAAWAWGFHRCVDALVGISYVDASKIAVTGHSRGGKCALLAGATDERIAFVNPNGSGLGGAGCHRYHMVEDEPINGDAESERLHYTMQVVPYWYCDALRSYVDRESEMPFDQHFLKAMVAPRCLLETEGLADIWSNPRGTLQTHLAALDVFRFLGVPENAGIHYHEGGHDHGFVDFVALLDFMECRMKGEPLPERLRQNPYPDMPLIFDARP